MATRKKKQNPDLQEETGVVDDPPETVAPEPVPQKIGEEAVSSEFTRCFRIRHAHFGSVRIFADKQEDAVESYCQKRCPGLDREKLLPELIIEELPFVPAATEAHKPYGWPRKMKGKVKS